MDIPFEEYFASNNTRIKDLMNNSKHPKTVKTLFGFARRSEALSKSILKLTDGDDFYGRAILCRGQIEHFLIAAHIWMKFRFGQGESCAEEYLFDFALAEYSIREDFNRKHGIETESTLSAILTVVVDKLSEEGLYNKVNSSLLQTASQFKVKRIMRELEKNFNELSYDRILSTRSVQRVVETYNILSSFVHGGPFAGLFFDEGAHIDKIKFSKELASWSTKSLGSIRLFPLYVLAVENKDFEPEFKEGVSNWLDNIE